MPKQITQAELRAVLDVYNQSLEMADKLQRRMQGGAKVETGDFTAANEYGESADDFTPTVRLEIGGVSIEPASNAAIQAEPQIGRRDWDVQRKAPLSEKPGWLIDTPGFIYVLEARSQFGRDNRDDQVLDLTIEEFESLKCHLAQLRGYAAQEVAHV